jgi:two-component system, OmpR family, phosphate regulon response regulator PhoB
MNPKILIVDDQPDLRKLVRLTLSPSHFELHEASDGLQAVEQARAIKPDLILLDVMMPGELNGLQVCAAIRQEVDLKAARIILLTARGQQTDLDEGFGVGADNYLVKPFSPTQLLDLVHRSVRSLEVQGG